MSAKVHVSAGLRYEYEREPAAQHPNAALDAVFGALRNGRAGSTSVVPEDTNNFGPRVSVAWQPLGTGKGTVHVGYGVYFGRLPGATVRAALIRYSAAEFGDACEDYAYNRDALPAGGESGVWVWVHVSDDTAGGGERDDYGDGVRPQVSSARGAAGKFRDRTWDWPWNYGECFLCDES